MHSAFHIILNIKIYDVTKNPWQLKAINGNRSYKKFFIHLSTNQTKGIGVR
jgi:hypothetical protein